MNAGVLVAIAVLVPLVWAAWQHQQYRVHLAGLREAIRELREDDTLLRRELGEARTQIAELAERVDFTERALVQVREAPSLPGRRQGESPG